MKFQHLQHRVARAERSVRVGTATTQQCFDALRRSWREAWTPPRIVLAGLVAGFVSGRANPVRSIAAFGGTHWLDLLGGVSGLVASFQAKDAAGQADDAVAGAGQAAAAANVATAQAADVAETAATSTPAAPPADAARAPQASPRTTTRTPSAQRGPGPRVDVRDVPETWRHHGHL